MQLVKYWSGTELRAGAVEGGKLVDAAKAGKYPSSLRTILANGQVDRLVTDARALIGRADTIDVSTGRLGPPIPNPGKILCLGLKYSDHAAEAKMECPAAPIIFPKFINSLEPGDIIATGTPAGIGASRKPPLWLKPNDIVEMGIEKVGQLRSRIQFRVQLQTEMR